MKTNIDNISPVIGQFSAVSFLSLALYSRNDVENINHDIHNIDSFLW